MIMKYFAFSTLFCLVCVIGYAQEGFNVQTLTPSSLLPSGKWEFKSFNSNYTQTAYFNEIGQKEDTPAGVLYFDDGTIQSSPETIRSTFFTSINQFNYGLNSKINIGFEIWINASAKTSDAVSRFKAIDFSQTANTRTVVSYLGTKIKLVPIPSKSNFSVQSIFLIPVSKDLESHQRFPRPFINWDNYTWLNQFFIDLPINDHWLVFLNLDLLWGLSRNSTVNTLRGNRFTIPVKVLFNYFANSRLTFLLQAEYNRIWQAFGDKETRQIQGAYYIQSGPSIKYQLISSRLEGEIAYSYFLAGNNGQGAGNSLSFGIRILL